jgi:acetyl/propionyl-CoA carboxylase alpha subunit
MIAKIITWAPDRSSALAALRAALAGTQVSLLGMACVCLFAIRTPQVTWQLYNTQSLRWDVQSFVGSSYCTALLTYMYCASLFFCRCVSQPACPPQVAGLPTNLPYLRRLAAHPAFEGCELDTGFVKQHESEWRFCARNAAIAQAVHATSAC